MEDRCWRCFHCDEVFTDPKAAAEHFGTEFDVPGCVDPLRTDEAARLREVREAKAHAEAMQREAEGKDDLARQLHDIRSELGRLFGKCAGFPVRTAHEAWLVLDAERGRTIAAEDKAKRLQAANTALARQVKAGLMAKGAPQRISG